MSESDDQRFAQLAAAVYAQSAAGALDERRRHPRTPAKGKLVTQLERKGGGVAVNAVVRDLSRGGIGLFSPVSLKRAEEFHLKVNLGSGLLHLKCKVANCRLGDDNRYIIGAHFVIVERDKDKANNETDGQEFISATGMRPDSEEGKQHLKEVQKQLKGLSIETA